VVLLFLAEEEGTRRFEKDQELYCVSSNGMGGLYSSGVHSSNKWFFILAVYYT
jgi:hypothetical protein